LLDTIYTQVAAVITLLVCGFAFWKGGRPEQWGGGVVILAQLSTVLLQDFLGTDQMALAAFGADAAVLIALGVIAWKSEQSWPAWASACQAITVAVHLAKLLDFRIAPFAYMSALAIAFYGMVLALAIGTFVAWREREALSPR